MEYPFKDLLPLDEVLEREGYYKDWTHLDPKVFYSLTQISEYIKTKGYGVDVRLLIAQLAEHFSLKTSQINEIELFFKDVMQELAEDKEFYSLPEIAGARRGYSNLAESLGNLSVNMINKNLGKLDQTYMSDEFLQQMTGNTPINAVPADGSVTTGKLADASVTTAKLADASVTTAKLDDAFGSRGDLSAGTDLKTLINQGVYFGQSNSNYLNTPTGFATNRYFELKVDVLSQAWAIQKFVDFTNPSNVWHKTVHRTNFSVNNDWEFVGTPANASVNRVKLSDNFSTSGTLASGTNLDTIVKEGVYLGLSTNSYTNMPSGTTGQSFVLKVQVGGAVNSFITQELIILGDSSKFYKRLNTNADNPDVWSEFKVSSSEGPGVTPSYFSDKTLLMFGDSITENGDYPERVGDYLGGATIKKAGFGGCRMAQHTQSGNGLHYDKMCMYRLVDYIESGDFSELTTAAEDMVRSNGDDNRPQSSMLAELDFSKVDIITIFFGTNDFGAADGVPIGTNDDTDGTTFKGAINKVIQKLSTVLPKAKLMFITPFYRNRLVTVGDGLNSDDEPNTRGVYLQEYVDAIKEICEIHHVPCLDLMAESGINRYNQHVYLSDGLHPSSPDGYEHVARKVVSGLVSNF